MPIRSQAGMVVHPQPIFIAILVVERSKAKASCLTFGDIRSSNNIVLELGLQRLLLYVDGMHHPVCKLSVPDNVTS